MGRLYGFAATEGRLQRGINFEYIPLPFLESIELWKRFRTRLSLDQSSMGPDQNHETSVSEPLPMTQSTASPRDLCIMGIAFIVEANLAGRTPTVIELTGFLGVKRAQLYDNKQFEPLRATASKLFGMFTRKADKPRTRRGKKSRDGDLEAWDED